MKSQRDDDQRARIKFDCDISCPCIIVLPLNQLSNQAILGETPSIRISNCFQLASTIADFKNFEVGNIFGIFLLLVFLLELKSFMID